MKTTVERQTPTHIRIRSKTADDAYDVVWDIYPGHATLTVNRTGDKKFWFLYEGTPGGRLDEGDRYVTGDGTSRPALHRENLRGDISPEWVFFSDSKTNRSLFIFITKTTVSSTSITAVKRAA